MPTRCTACAHLVPSGERLDEEGRCIGCVQRGRPAIYPEYAPDAKPRPRARARDIAAPAKNKRPAKRAKPKKARRR